MKSSMMMMKMMAEIQVEEGEKEGEGMVERHQDHHQIYGGNTPAENSRRIAQANDERFQNRRLRETEREILNIPMGIVKSTKSSMDINFPDNPPAISYGGDFIPHPPYSPRETSFLFPNGSLSPLRNRLPNIAPLPWRSSIDNFARPLTQIIDDESNTTEITPKKPAPNIKETNLSKRLQEIFPNVNKVIKEDSNDFKEKIDDLNEILDKKGKDEDGDDQKLFEFEFFIGGKIKNLINILDILVFQAII